MSTREIDYAIAQLRHAYALLLAGSVVDHRQFAQGMLGPVIERLERLANTSPPIWCAAHQSYKWCEHNGGVLGPTGYEAPAITGRGDPREVMAAWGSMRGVFSGPRDARGMPIDPEDVAGRVPRAATAVLCVSRGCILVQDRTTDGLVVTPGGKIEAGETVRDCAARELREETGIVAGMARILAVARCPGWVVYLVRALPLDGWSSVVDVEGLGAWRWATPAELLADHASGRRPLIGGLLAALEGNVDPIDREDIREMIEGEK